VSLSNATLFANRTNEHDRLQDNTHNALPASRLINLTDADNKQ